MIRSINRIEVLYDDTSELRDKRIKDWIDKQPLQWELTLRRNNDMGVHLLTGYAENTSQAHHIQSLMHIAICASGASVIDDEE